MKLLSLDLEFNQPSGKIIQIGACVGDLYTGEIIEDLSVLTKIDEQITQYIENLTGIDNCGMNDRLSLAEGYGYLEKMVLRHHCPKGMTLTWGVGDVKALQTQLGFNEDWLLGRRFLDVKTMYIAYALSNDLSIRGGLAKTLTRLGLKFVGKKHNAKDDAINTFRVAYELHKQFQKNSS